jgi:glycosyltransferase involved in cell wall biosynthesis
VSPLVSVVVVTHNRAGRLAALLRTLERQTLGPERFEVIVVDDASSDETPRLLEDQIRCSALQLRVVRRPPPPGRAAARNAGWSQARADLVAYIDDDCVAAQDWLEQGVRKSQEHAGAVVQGRVDPIPAEESLRSPATRTQRIHQAGPYFQTCNIFYPRRLIERLGGFDADTFALHGGEDSDLAWRAISAGAATVFADQARAYHAVNHLGLIGRLRFAAHWHESMVVYKRHPALRDQVFTKRIFWKTSHYGLTLFLLALVLPRRFSFLTASLMRPYLRSLRWRLHEEHGRPKHALFFVIEDLVEMSSMVRASIRYRMLVL